MIHEEKQREGWMFTEWFPLNCSVCNIFLLLEQPSVLSTKQPFHRVTENLYIILSSYCSIILSYLYLAFVQLVSLIYLACVEDTLNRIAVVSPTSRVDSPKTCRQNDWLPLNRLYRAYYTNGRVRCVGRLQRRLWFIEHTLFSRSGRGLIVNWTSRARRVLVTCS